MVSEPWAATLGARIAAGTEKNSTVSMTLATILTPCSGPPPLSLVAAVRRPLCPSHELRQVVEDRAGDERAVLHRSEVREAGKHFEAPVAERLGHEGRHHGRQVVARRHHLAGGDHHRAGDGGEL